MNKKYNGKTLYYLGDEYTGMNKDRHLWIKEHLDESQYVIRSEGFLIEEYYVEFKNTQDEAEFVFTWEIQNNT